jgi:hypothetical protein
MSLGARRKRPHLPDTGEDPSTYYRAAYHSRSYIRQGLARYFEIVDVIVRGHHFSQDYAMLRRPAG